MQVEERLLQRTHFYTLTSLAGAPSPINIHKHVGNVDKRYSHTITTCQMKLRVLSSLFSKYGSIIEARFPQRSCISDSKCRCWIFAPDNED